MVPLEIWADQCWSFIYPPILLNHPAKFFLHPLPLHKPNQKVWGASYERGDVMCLFVWSCFKSYVSFSCPGPAKVWGASYERGDVMCLIVWSCFKSYVFFSCPGLVITGRREVKLIPAITRMTRMIILTIMIVIMRMMRLKHVEMDYVKVKPRGNILEFVMYPDLFVCCSLITKIMIRRMMKSKLMKI